MEMVAPGVVGTGNGKMTSSRLPGLAGLQLPAWSHAGAVALPPTHVSAAPAGRAASAPTAAMAAVAMAACRRFFAGLRRVINERSMQTSGDVRRRDSQSIQTLSTRLARAAIQAHKKHQ